MLLREELLKSLANKRAFKPEVIQVPEPLGGALDPSFSFAFLWDLLGFSVKCKSEANLLKIFQDDRNVFLFKNVSYFSFPYLGNIQ